MVAACRPGGRKTVPLALKLWSSRSPGFKGENDEVLKIVKAVYAATGGKGVVVYDRGGDRPAFYDYFIEENRDFIVRLKGRSVLSWGGMHEVRDLAGQCTMRHSHHVTFDSHGKECNVPVSFGAMPGTLARMSAEPTRMRWPSICTSSVTASDFPSLWTTLAATVSSWYVRPSPSSSQSHSV
jgi:hypothetical protein